MFRTDTLFVIRSLHITVYAAVCTYHAENIKTIVFNVSHAEINLLKPTRHVMHQQFNIQQLYVLSTLYLCVLYLSENEQRLVPLIA